MFVVPSTGRMDQSTKGQTRISGSVVTIIIRSPSKLFGASYMPMRLQGSARSLIYISPRDDPSHFQGTWVSPPRSGGPESIYICRRYFVEDRTNSYS